MKKNNNLLKASVGLVAFFVLFLNLSTIKSAAGRPESSFKMKNIALAQVSAAEYSCDQTNTNRCATDDQHVSTGKLIVIY